MSKKPTQTEMEREEAAREEAANVEQAENIERQTVKARPGRRVNADLQTMAKLDRIMAEVPPDRVRPIMAWLISVYLPCPDPDCDVVYVEAPNLNPPDNGMAP